MGILTVDIEESKRRIKQTVEWFPGVILKVKRQSGKSTAILEMIHERHGGKAAFVTFDERAASFAHRQYIEWWPEDERPIFTFDVRTLAGKNLPIYVDETHSVSARNSQLLDDFGSRVVCRIGTER